MGENRKFFWMKLKKDFFASKRIKKLRKIAGGDTYTIIYLKMQLKALDTDGFLYFDGYMDNFYEELALDIDEDPENVKVTVTYLMSVGLIECNSDGTEWRLPYLKDCIGSETASTQRSRVCRARKKEQEMLQCNTDATPMKQKTLQCNTDATKCNTEIEKEKEIELEREECNMNSEKNQSSLSSSKEMNEIVTKWNELSEFGVPKIRTINKNSMRAKLVRAIKSKHGKGCFDKAINEIRKSKFLLGQNPNKPWIVTFDWLIKPDNFAKVIQGSYETFENKDSPKIKNNDIERSNYDFDALEKDLVEN